MPSVAIEPLSNVQLHDAVAVTSRAFWPDPLFGFFAKDSVHEHRSMPRYVGAIIRDSFRHGEVDAALIDGRLVGTASWLPFTGAPRSEWRELTIATQCLPAIVMGRNRRMAISLLRSMDKKHPSEPHVYLALLGVDPSAQGQGIGKFLLQPRLDHCDENGFPVYLETQKPENLPYYERFGFKVRDTVALDRTPTIWSMWRDPR